MAEYDEATYGDRIAKVYDARPGVPRNADLVVEFLSSIAGSRRVLELGIGTGRIALPLAARGHRVVGIDASEKMVAEMRKKPGGDAIPVVFGNFAEVKAPGVFSLIYVVFNTFFALRSQEEQVRCFERVARHLAPGGAFVIESFVFDPQYYTRNQHVSVLSAEVDRATLHVATHDPSTQTSLGGHIDISEKGISYYPVQVRYAYPSELDLMARIAGMRLRERYGGWKREPFNASSTAQVSVYELIPQTANPARRVVPIGSAKRRKLAKKR